MHLEQSSGWVFYFSPFCTLHFLLAWKALSAERHNKQQSNSYRNNSKAGTWSYLHVRQRQSTENHPWSQIHCDIIQLDSKTVARIMYNEKCFILKGFSVLLWIIWILIYWSTHLLFGYILHHCIIYFSKWTSALTAWLRLNAAASAKLPRLHPMDKVERSWSTTHEYVVVWGSCRRKAI